MHICILIGRGVLYVFLGGITLAQWGIFDILVGTYMLVVGSLYFGVGYRTGSKLSDMTSAMGKGKETNPAVVRKMFDEVCVWVCARTAVVIVHGPESYDGKRVDMDIALCRCVFSFLDHLPPLATLQDLIHTSPSTPTRMYIYIHHMSIYT